ncbi:MAG: hypothetical protein HQL97_08665 [Magnetococcales bacterium]|nr:hypothetical protein [Magnetococcales bacterium]
MNTTLRTGTLLRLLGSAWLRSQFQMPRDHLARLSRLPRSRAFAKVAWRDQRRYLTGTVQPVDGVCRQRAHATAEWLIRAWEATPDDGLSEGYFPCDPQAFKHSGHGWRPSCPQSTGSGLSALLDYALRFSNAVMRERLLAMAHWAADLQMPSGAIQTDDRGSDPREATRLATGMVLHGFAALLKHEPDPRIDQAAHRAADFLVRCLDWEAEERAHPLEPVPARSFQANQVLGAWGLHLFGTLKGVTLYREAALRLARNTLALQQENGWFARNDPARNGAPRTLAIAQTVQGLLETGIASGDTTLIDAARRGTLPLVQVIRPSGFLPGRWHADWSQASRSACLTGSAQLSVVCFRLYQTLGDATFLEAGHRLVDFLKGVQVVDPFDSPMRGALAGSFPLFFGPFQSAGFPSSTSQYLLHALLLQDRIIEARG